MKRRPLLWLGILLAMGLGLALAFLTSHYVLIGLLQEPRDVPATWGISYRKAGAAAVPVLVDMLQEEDDEARFQALLALLAMKPGEAAAAASALERTWINDKTNFHRHFACLALVKARQFDTKLLLTLAQGEGDCGPLMAVWKDLGPEAQAAVPGLLQALQSPDETIRRCATIVLGHMGPSILAKEAVCALAARLKDGSIAVRRGAACALGKMGPKAGEAVPALIEALQDIDTETRVEAACDIGPAASTAVPHLGRAVKDAETAVRRTAAYALGWIGPAAKAAVPELIEALKDKDEYTRSSAAEALGRIGPVASTAIPGLIAALQDESVHVRRYAAHALGQIALAQAQIP